MLLDLLSTDNLATYNIKIAQVMGLHTAIYINELINISNKAILKKKLIADKYFILSRSYITKRTTIEIEEQLTIDSKLEKVNVIIKPDNEQDTIYLDIDKLASIISSDDVEFLSKVKKKTEVKTAALPGMKQSMKQRQIEEFKKYITVTHPELKDAYEGWIEAVMQNPKGFLSKRAIKIFQETIDSFADGYLDIALRLIDIATVGGYRDATWAINKYNDENRNNRGNLDRNNLVNTSQRRVNLSDEIF